MFACMLVLQMYALVSMTWQALTRREGTGLRLKADTSLCA